MKRRDSLAVVVLLMLWLFTFAVVSPLCAATIISAHVDADTTWNVAGSPYLVKGDINVDNGITLTIDPGTVIKFHPDASLNVYGEILANGTSASPITFTSNVPTPGAGNWDYLCFLNSGSTTSVLNNCIVEYADTGVWVRNAGTATDPTIRNCTIRKVIASGIDVGGGCAPVLGGNKVQDCRGPAVILRSNSKPVFDAAGTYTNCRPSAVAFEAGFRVQDDWTLAKIGGPYQTLGDVFVDSTWEWVLEAGTELRMARRCNLNVYGTLTAIGSTTANTIFTSAAGVPAPGDWGEILFQGSGSNASVLQNCQVNYGGADRAAVRCNNYGSPANPTLNATKITYSKHHGVLVQDSQPTLRAMNFTKCATAALRYENSSEPVIAGAWVYSGNGFNGVELESGFNFTGDYTMYKACAPYRTTGDLILPAGATLTIEPNTTIRFAEGSGFSLYGNLQAIAPAGMRVNFTSDLPNPTAGDWRGLRFQDSGTSGSVLDRCAVSYAGLVDNTSIWCRYYYTPANPTLIRCTVQNGLGHGVWIGASKPKLDALTVKGCTGAAVVVAQDSFPNIVSNPTFTDNGYDALMFTNGYELSANYTLVNRGVPWGSLGGAFTVRAGKTLTIAPGVRFLLETNGAFNVYGIVKANGTAAEPIEFGGWNASSPRVWRQMMFMDAGTNTSVLKYCVIHHAGYDSQAALWVRRYYSATSPKFDYCSIQDNHGAGVYVNGASTRPVFTHCTVTRNLGWGVYADGDAQPNFGNTGNTIATDDGLNTITANYLGGFFNNTNKAQFAQNSWWGTSVAADIAGMIWDKTDEAWRGTVLYSPFLAAAPTSGPRLANSGLTTLTAAAALPSPAGGAVIVCGLTGPASVGATITNIAGRVVSVLPPTQGDTGLQTLVWSGKSAFGTKVPRGRYLVDLMARGTDGTQSKRLLALDLR